MPRRPGDIVDINNLGSGKRETFYPGSTLLSSTVNHNSIYLDNRRTYSKGTRTKLGTRYWIYPTAYSHYSREVKSPGQATQKFPGVSGIVTTTETNPPISTILTSYGGYAFNSLAGIEYTNAANGAKVKALNSLAQNKAGVGEDLFTYMQVVRMLASKASLLHAVLSLFKKDKRMAAHFGSTLKSLAKNGDKKLAAAYLEYVYGWKPLVSDIYGIVQLLRDYANGSKPIIIHGHGTQNQPGGGYWQTPLNSNGFTAFASVDEQAKAKCDIYAKVDPQYYAFRVLNQLGLFNPAAIAWEVTPWSFVVDWFIPIGPVLSAFTAPIGLNFISGTVGIRSTRTFTGEYRVRQGTSANAGVLIDTPIAFTVIDQMYSRTTLGTWPFPTPYLDLNPLRGDRWIKALALLIVNLRR